MPKKSLNLDVDCPEKVIDVLLEAADAYQESANELTADWQDPSAGRPWYVLTHILYQAAVTAEKRLKKIGYPIKR